MNTESTVAFSLPLYEQKICFIHFNVYTQNLDKIDSQITSNPRPYLTGTLTLGVNGYLTTTKRVLRLYIATHLLNKRMHLNH